MKKVIIALFVIGLAFSSLGDIGDGVPDGEAWEYKFLADPSGPGALTGTETTGDGGGWYAALFSTAPTTVTNISSQLTSTKVGGWTGSAFYINEKNLSGTGTTILEGTDVFMRVYDNADASLAANYYDSQIYTLQDVDPVVNTSDVEVDLVYSSGSWQAVPEPASMALIALGGVLTWLLRLKQRWS